MQFTFHYSMYEPPHIQNDVITINRQYAADHQVKLAISHALAQSTLLGCYEEQLQVWGLVGAAAGASRGGCVLCLRWGHWTSPNTQG
jgi:hypothetical protein